MTPRERAKAAIEDGRERISKASLAVIGSSHIWNHLEMALEAAIIADRRELLADDEATIEAMAQEVCRHQGYIRITKREREFCSGILAALRALKSTSGESE